MPPAPSIPRLPHHKDPEGITPEAEEAAEEGAVQEEITIRMEPQVMARMNLERHGGAEAAIEVLAQEATVH